MAFIKEDVINGLQEVKDYFLSVQEGTTKIDNNELLKNLTKITTSIIFDEGLSKKVKVNFLIFWINYLIDNHTDELTSEIKVSIGNLISNLDLFQLNSYIVNNGLSDNNIVFSTETRKILGDDITLTDCQIDILFAILENKNIIFSAPTSYGKSSIVINSLFLRLKNKEINNVVFVIPSKALINEYRKKFNKLISFYDYSVDINENPYIPMSEGIQHVHLFTQERLLIFEQINNIKIDYVVFDEVQELLAINKENPERAVLLAKTISIFENKQAPMVFLMPYIQNPEDEFINYFTDSDFLVKKDLYSPTTSNKYLIVKENNNYQLYDVTLNKGFSKIFEQHDLGISQIYPSNSFYDIKYDFYKICQSLDILKDKSLCYCNKSNLSSVASEFQKNKEKMPISGRLASLIKYLGNYIHPDFELISFLEKGIAIHHADLDTFTKRQIEECFKDVSSGLNLIFCTSTLLQGVNLNANNLFFLAPKGSFTNAELDKKNLFGRVGRIGSKLQGNIFKFWVEGQRTKKETEAKELNSANDEYVVKDKILTINTDKVLTDDYINSYYQDKEIKKKLKTSKPIKINQLKLDNFDYFLGKNKSNIVDRKIKNMSSADRQVLENKMKFASRSDCEYVIKKLCELYDWVNSKNFDEKYRMTSIPYITTVFYNNYLGRSVKSSIEDMIKLNEDNDSNFVLAILRKSGGDLYPKILSKMTYRNNPQFVRLYQNSDINLLIYSYIYETQNIIEFRVKKYLQDLYYRLLKSQGKSLQSIEDYLIYSTANNKRKINLNKMGLLDSFAIDELTSKSDLFENDVPIPEKIKQYALSLEEDNPLRYAILDAL